MGLDSPEPSMPPVFPYSIAGKSSFQDNPNLSKLLHRSSREKERLGADLSFVTALLQIGFAVSYEEEGSSLWSLKVENRLSSKPSSPIPLLDSSRLFGTDSPLLPTLTAAQGIKGIRQMWTDGIEDEESMLSQTRTALSHLGELSLNVLVESLDSIECLLRIYSLGFAVFSEGSKESIREEEKLFVCSVVRIIMGHNDVSSKRPVSNELVCVLRLVTARLSSTANTSSVLSKDVGAALETSGIYRVLLHILRMVHSYHPDVVAGSLLDPLMSVWHSTHEWSQSHAAEEVFLVFSSRLSTLRLWAQLTGLCLRCCGVCDDNRQTQFADLFNHLLQFFEDVLSCIDSNLTTSKCISTDFSSPILAILDMVLLSWKVGFSPLDHIPSSTIDECIQTLNEDGRLQRIVDMFGRIIFKSAHLPSTALSSELIVRLHHVSAWLASILAASLSSKGATTQLSSLLRSIAGDEESSAFASLLVLSSLLCLFLGQTNTEGIDTNKEDVDSSGPTRMISLDSLLDFCLLLLGCSSDEVNGPPHCLRHFSSFGIGDIDTLPPATSSQDSPLLQQAVIAASLKSLRCLVLFTSTSTVHRIVTTLQKALLEQSRYHLTRYTEDVPAAYRSVLHSLGLCYGTLLHGLFRRREDSSCSEVLEDPECLLIGFVDALLAMNEHVLVHLTGENRKEEKEDNVTDGESTLQNCTSAFVVPVIFDSFGASAVDLLQRKEEKEKIRSLHSVDFSNAKDGGGRALPTYVFQMLAYRFIPQLFASLERIERERSSIDPTIVFQKTHRWRRVTEQRKATLAVLLSLLTQLPLPEILESFPIVLRRVVLMGLAVASYSEDDNGHVKDQFTELNDHIGTRSIYLLSGCMRQADAISRSSALKRQASFYVRNSTELTSFSTSTQLEDAICFIAEDARPIVECTVGLACRHPIPLVRFFALQLLISYKDRDAFRTLPMSFLKKMIDRLSGVLDDPKRIVRTVGAICSNAWSGLLAQERIREAVSFAANKRVT